MSAATTNLGPTTPALERHLRLMPPLPAPRRPLWPPSGVSLRVHALHHRADRLVAAARARTQEPTA